MANIEGSRGETQPQGDESTGRPWGETEGGASSKETLSLGYPFYLSKLIINFRSKKYIYLSIEMMSLSCTFM